MGAATYPDLGPLRSKVLHLASQRGEDLDDDDIADVAHLAMERAIRRWKPSGGASIDTFAWHLVERAYSDVMTPRRNEVPMTCLGDTPWLARVDEAYSTE